MNHRDPQCASFQRGFGANFAPVEFKAALEFSVDAREDFDEGAFARAVFTRQHMHLARKAFQVGVAQDGHRAEAFGDAAHPHQRRLMGTCVRRHVYLISRISSVPDLGS